MAFLDTQHHAETKLGSWAVLSANWDDDSQNEVYSAMEWEGWMAAGIASHAASALGDDRHNTTHDGARQALSFARARAKSPWCMPEEPLDKPRSAVFPVVVTQAPLFTCELGFDGEVVLKRVDEFDVRIHVDRTTRHRVYVKSEAAMERMAERLGKVRRRFPA